RCLSRGSRFRPHVGALSVGIQQMVRADLAGSGVMFSIDTGKKPSSSTQPGGAKGNQDSLDKFVRKCFLHGSSSCPMAILGNPGGELAVLVDSRYPARVGNKRAEFG